METKKLVSFSCEVSSGVLKVLTDGNYVYHAETLICLNGGAPGDSLLEALRQPEKYPELCEKMEEHGYKLVGNTYVLQ